MEIAAPINRTFNLTTRFLRFCLCLVAISLCCCTSSRRPTICGVPVQGTPWQFAASIHDNISGYLVPDALLDSLGNPLSADRPATLICDLTPSGEVCGAAIHCETKEE